MNGQSPRFARVFGLFIALILVQPGCGAGNQRYKAAINEGEQARRARNFQEEQTAFERAIEAANDDDERTEALYRQAHSQLREGNVQVAAKSLEGLAQKYPNSARAARAWLDAGRSWEKLGDNEAASHSYKQVWLKYPESGNALAAAKRTVLLDQSSDESLKWKKLLAQNKSAVLRPALLYELGLSLETTAPLESILVFEEVARLAPLPGGTYTDEALLHAARLRRQARDFQGALQTLQLLVPRGGQAAIVGSYNRPAYAEALLLQGYIQRDDLRNLDAAKANFLALAERFPESRLVDDALWEAAVTEHLSQGDGCPGIERLRSTSPSSTYLLCSATICPIDGEPIPANCEQQRAALKNESRR